MAQTSISNTPTTPALPSGSRPLIEDFAYFPRARFEMLLTDYLVSKKDSNRKPKIFVDIETEQNAIEILTNTNNKSLHRPLRQWVLKFQVLTVGCYQYLYHLNKKKKVCMKNMLYEVVVGTHNEMVHSGMIKTWQRISVDWLYVPQEIVRSFVQACPICVSRLPLANRTQTSARPILEEEFLSRVQV